MGRCHAATTSLLSLATLDKDRFAARALIGIACADSGAEDRRVLAVRLRRVQHQALRLQATAQANPALYRQSARDRGNDHHLIGNARTATWEVSGECIGLTQMSVLIKQLRLCKARVVVYILARDRRLFSRAASHARACSGNSFSQPPSRSMIFSGSTSKPVQSTTTGGSNVGSF